MKKPTNVDEYIYSCPKEHQEKLTNLRTLIRSSAPKAEEKISYGMPYYGYKGRLAYFALAKKHIGLYIPPPTTQEFKKELAKYHTSKSAIQFPLETKLPVTLIKKLIKSRAAYNELKKTR